MRGDEVAELERVLEVNKTFEEKVCHIAEKLLGSRYGSQAEAAGELISVVGDRMLQLRGRK